MVRTSLLACALLAGCSRSNAAQSAPDAAASAATITTETPAIASDAGAPSAKAAKREPADLNGYLKSKLPKGGAVSSDNAISHTVQGGDTAASIAKEYLELTEIYAEGDFAKALSKLNLTPGAKIVIPRPLTRVPRDPKEERLGWPEDQALRGVFVTGPYASIRWADTVEKVEDHGLNAIVLDAKDYDGYVNYPSKAKIAVESGAIRDKNIPDLVRAIRYAHWHNVRIILRVPCFHDPWADKHLPDSRLSLKFTPTGKPIHVDWIDPTNPESQDYALEIAKEGLDAGADEIQLDYVRFPVHISTKTAVLPQRADRPAIIRDFVKRAREVTKAAGAHLSLDFFGVAATGERDDILALGQDIATVAPEADAISLMSYPSHYGKHFMGWANAADHAEIIAMGNKAAIAQLKPTGAKTVFRTWLQAFPNGVTHYGSAYLQAQAKYAEESGGVGWLMWSPGCEYAPVWNGWPSKSAKK
jgi:hypothetical protein